MGTNLSFNAKYVVTGSADIRSSGHSIKDAFNALKLDADPIAALEGQHPAGNDSTGQQFLKWYNDFKADIIKQGAEVGDYVADVADNTDMAVAEFVKTDLDNAADLKVE